MPIKFPTMGALKREVKKDAKLKAGLDQIFLQKSEIEKDAINFFRKKINSQESDLKLPEKYLELFLKYSKVCKTRIRKIEESTDVFDEKKGGLFCYQNAINVANEKGYRLFSGYSSDSFRKESRWHCFNLDPQGYVYDASPNSEMGMFGSVYFGIEYDPYFLQIHNQLETKNASDKKTLEDVIMEGVDYLKSILLNIDKVDLGEEDRRFILKLFRLENKKDQNTDLNLSKEDEYFFTTQLRQVFIFIISNYHLRNLVEEYESTILNRFRGDENKCLEYLRAAMVLSKI